jgi:hypothetical protein
MRLSQVPNPSTETEGQHKIAREPNSVARGRGRQGKGTVSGRRGDLELRNTRGNKQGAISLVYWQKIKSCILR